MIITGGEHVYPSEVEELVGGHYAVDDCACIGMPDEKWGEKVAVVVVLKSGASGAEINEQDIKEYCKKNLSTYKCPKEVVFIAPEAMPRTATGKILHRKLREKLVS
jgi:acyl-CoA synthetase (AMP-forming)/AMP-acid ligase II